MNIPSISVIMPVYNAQAYLQEAIESILGQTRTDFELIIVNDGSTDASEAIIRSFDDPRIVYLKNETNLRIVRTLNKAIAHAKGRYIARMDADDISHPERLHYQYEFMEKHPDIGICGTCVEMFGPAQKPYMWKLPLSDEAIRAEMLFSSPFAHPSVMIRKSLFEDYALAYEEPYLHAEDYALWSRLADVTRMANLPLPLLKYRVLSTSVTRLADAELELRHRVLRSIYEPLLSQLSIHNSPQEDMLHFTLTLNDRIRENPVDPSRLSAYFDTLLAANRRTPIYAEDALKRVFGKKWLWNLVYSFRLHPLRTLQGIFSQYFLYGLSVLFQKYGKRR